MAKVIRDKAFQDQECTCNCGNKHELYGGKGYKTVECVGNEHLYRHIVTCNACNKKHINQY